MSEDPADVLPDEPPRSPNAAELSEAHEDGRHTLAIAKRLRSSVTKRSTIAIVDDRRGNEAHPIAGQLTPPSQINIVATDRCREHHVPSPNSRENRPSDAEVAAWDESHRGDVECRQIEHCRCSILGWNGAVQEMLVDAATHEIGGRQGRGHLPYPMLVNHVVGVAVEDEGARRLARSGLPRSVDAQAL